MRIGIIPMPGRHSFNGQSIKPKFFILGLPLFPTGCFYKISDNLGIDVPLTGADVFHGFAKFHFGLGGIGLVIWANNMYGGHAGKILLLIAGVVLTCLSIFSWVKHYRTDREDELPRRVFGKAFMYNMLPEYLPAKAQTALYGELLRIYTGKFGKTDWLSDLNAGRVDKSNFALLYTMAYYHKTIQPTANNELIFQKAAAYLNKNKSAQNTATTTQTASYAAPSPTQTSAASSPKPAGQTNNLDDLVRTAQQSMNRGGNKANSNTRTTTPPAGGRNANRTVASEEKITSRDADKLRAAKSEMTNQLLMFAGLLFFGFIVVTMLSGGGGTMLITVFFMMLIIYGGISLAVYYQPFTKINRDLQMRKKILVKVRIKDIAKEQGTVYLKVQPNSYGIKQIQGPAQYYSMDLLNKELEIYVGKYSHTLFEVVRVSY